MLLGGATELFDPGSAQVSDNNPQQQQARDLVKRTALSVPGVTFWDLRNNLCAPEKNCPYLRGEVPLYMDDGHLSPAGALKALDGWRVPVAKP